MSVNTETGEIATTINYAIHPAAEIFPLIEGEAFASFVEDIRTRGQEDPVVLDGQGRLLDGRNRARACQALGIDVKETRYHGDDPVGFVVSHNMQRRHLTESQRAMVAARLANMRQGARTDLGSIDPKSAVSTEDAAKTLNVSTASVKRAKTISRHGTDDEKKSVEDGQATVSKVAKTIRERRGTTKRTPPEKPRRERADLIAELAAQGYSSRQIARQVDLTDSYVRRVAREQAIEIPADTVMGKTRRHDSTKIAAAIVADLESMYASIELIDYDDLDQAQVGHWVNSLDESFKILNRFRKQIKELTQ